MKKRLFNLAVVLLTAVIFIMLMFFTHGVDELVSLLANIKYHWIGAAFGCMVMYWVMDSLVLLSVTKALFEEQRFADSIKVTMVGQFFNSITPFATGGQPAQAYVMIKDGIRAGHSASILIIKSILYQATLVLYTLVMVVTRGSMFVAGVPHFFYVYLFGIFANMCTISLYFMSFYNKAMAQKILGVIFSILGKLRVFKKLDKHRTKFESELEGFSDGAIELKNNKGVMVKSFIFQIMQLTFYFIIPYFIFLGVESGKTSLWNMIAAQSIVTMITLMIPSPGSSGGAEGTGYLFFSMFFSQGTVLPVILIWRIVTYYSAVIFGGLVSMFSPERPLKSE